MEDQPMKVLKFTINEKYYEAFKSQCQQEDITVKRKLNVLLAQDRKPANLLAYYPEDSKEDLRKLTLKVNEELYKGVMKKCGQMDYKVRQYLPYLIYRYLQTVKEK